MQGPRDVAGQSTAIAVLTPSRRAWAGWLRADFAALDRFKGWRNQQQPSRPVRRLSFISFARWAVTDRLGERKLPYPYILFQSNFNGASAEYFEAFGRGLKWRMRGLWAGAYGVPDPSKLIAFDEYIRRHWVPCDHYYCAYPQATTKTILSGLELRRAFLDFAAAAPSLPAAEFRTELSRLVQVLQRPVADPGLRSITDEARPEEAGKPVINRDGFCALTTVPDSNEGSLRAHLRRLPTGMLSPMIRVPGTHYARWAVVQLRDPAGGRIPDQTYLLFSAEFDGELDAYLADLLRGLGEDARGIYEQSSWDEGRQSLTEYLLEHRVRPGYSVVAYPGVGLDDVRAAFALQERLGDFLVRTSTLDPPALKTAWDHRFRGFRAAA